MSEYECCIIRIKERVCLSKTFFPSCSSVDIAELAEYARHTIRITVHYCLQHQLGRSVNPDSAAATAATSSERAAWRRALPEKSRCLPKDSPPAS